MNDFERINEMMKQGGVFMHEATGKKYYTGYEYTTLYDWDQYFENIVLFYLGWSTEYAENGVTIFCDLQKENGHIQRSSKGCEEQLSEHVKPFLFQICLLIYNRRGNVDFLSDNGAHYYNRLKKYLEYWLEDLRGFDSLSYWDSAPHTGMDNQRERAGNWHEREKFCCGVDLNSYLVRECRAAAVIAELLSDNAYADLMKDTAEKIKASMIKLFIWSHGTKGLFSVM